MKKYIVIIKDPAISDFIQNMLGEDYLVIVSYTAKNAVEFYPILKDSDE